METRSAAKRRAHLEESGPSAKILSTDTQCNPSLGETCRAKESRIQASEDTLSGSQDSEISRTTGAKQEKQTSFSSKSRDANNAKAREMSTEHTSKLPEINPGSGKPISITSDMAHALDSIEGVNVFGINGDQNLVVYCQPKTIQTSRRRFIEFENTFHIRPIIIEQEMQSRLATQPGWKFQDLEEIGLSCAVGLPVLVNDGVEDKPAIMGCFHYFQDREEVVSGRNGMKTINADLEKSCFVACFNDSFQVRLGKRVIGVYQPKEEVDVALIFVEPPGVTKANYDAPDSYFMKGEEVSALAVMREVGKRGPITGDTKGALKFRYNKYVTYPNGDTGERFSSGVMVDPSSAKPFSKCGDSGSIVFLTPQSGSDKERALLGLVHGCETNSSLTYVFPYYRQLEALYFNFDDIKAIAPTNFDFKGAYQYCF